LSREILEQLRERTAFKPSPPEFEMAAAHVSPAEVGVPDSIDQRVYDAMCSDDEAFVIIQGAPGWGKSSLLTSAAWRAAGDTANPQVLPLRLGVGHHTAPITPDLLVRSVAQELALRLAPKLHDKDVRRLERALAITVVWASTSPKISAGVTVPIPHVPPLSANVAVDLGGDLTQLVSAGGWSGNPINGLLSLRDLAAARGARLVIIFDDTDTWAEGDETLALRARDFFVAVRALADVPEITIFVAIQDHWAIDIDGDVEPNTDAARTQYRALAERAARLLHLPRPADIGQAQALIAAIINRRAEITLNETLEGGWTGALFDEDAIALLAKRILEHSVRQALADIRNAFDHAVDMPERITRDYLAVAMG
jgi:AAA ATPase domain